MLVLARTQGCDNDGRDHRGAGQRRWAQPAVVRCTRRSFVWRRDWMLARPERDLDVVARANDPCLECRPEGDGAGVARNAG